MLHLVETTYWPTYYVSIVVSPTVMVFIVKSYIFEIDASLVWMKSVLFVLQNRKTIHIPNRDVLYCIDNSVRLQDLHKIMKFQL